MAEGEGFEPPVPFQAQRFSRPPVSTAHPSLRKKCGKVHRQFIAGAAKSSSLKGIPHMLGGKPRKIGMAGSSQASNSAFSLVALASRLAC